MPSLRASLFALCLTLSSPVALSQAISHADAQSSGQVEGTTRRYERPDEGLQRGLWSVPSWVPVAGGVAIFLAAAAGLALRFTRKPKS
jgi:hypothetical protein